MPFSARSFAPLYYGLLRRYAASASWRSFATNSHTSSATGSSVAAGSPATKDAAHHHEEHVGLYNIPHHEHHDDPRKFLNSDGTYQYPVTPHTFHYEDPYSHVPKQQIVSVAGKKMIKGIEARPMVELFNIHQVRSPSVCGNGRRTRTFLEPC